MAVVLGILAAYGVVVAILNGFGQQPAGAAPLLVPSETAAGGD